MEKNYKVYGIGNALVDIEFEVSDELLSRLEVEKGLMTLVDQSKIKLFNDSSDLNIKHKSCGGSAGNTLIALSQLGQKAYYSCKVADDDFGRFFHDELLKTGLDTNLSNGLSSHGQTGQCMVFVTPDAERTMNTHLGITETFSVDEIDFEQLKNSEFLYVEGYLVTSETGRKAAQESMRIARANGVKTALTFSDPSMPTYFKDGLVEMIGNDKVDLLFCNKEELEVFSGEKDLHTALEKVSKLARRIVMTNGAAGALYFENGEIIEASAPEVTPIDTVGAGDLFAGAFLYSSLEGNDIKKCLEFSCACASKVVTQYGSRLNSGVINQIKETYLG